MVIRYSVVEPTPHLNSPYRYAVEHSTDQSSELNLLHVVAGVAGADAVDRPEWVMVVGAIAGQIAENEEEVDAVANAVANAFDSIAIQCDAFQAFDSIDLCGWDVVNFDGHFVNAVESFVVAVAVADVGVAMLRRIRALCSE